MPPATLQHPSRTWLFVGIPLLFSAVFFGIGMIFHPLPWESASWPKTPGIITSFTIVETRNRGSHFDAVATYQYEVAGQTYRGNDAVFPLNRYHRRDSIDRIEANRRAEALQLRGKSMMVFYDPDDPSRSTLQPGMQNFIIMYFLFGSACLLFALSQIWSLRK